MSHSPFRSRSWVVVLAVAGACQWGHGPVLENEGDLTAAVSNVTGLETDGGQQPTLSPVANAECDMNGVWIGSEHTLQVGLGGSLQQRTTTLEYWELSQVGADLTVARHLICDIRADDVGTLRTSNVTYTTALRDGIMRHMTHTGRTGSYGADGKGGCELHLERAAFVRGATMPFYANAQQSLPDTEATQATPGSEDWDGDGAPGITLQLTGAATGRLFMVYRAFDEPRGTTQRNATRFRVNEALALERVVLGRDPANMPSGETFPSDAVGANYRWFQRAPVDAFADASDDADVCARVRALAKDELPEAFVAEGV